MAGDRDEHVFVDVCVGEIEPVIIPQLVGLAQIVPLREIEPVLEFLLVAVHGTRVHRGTVPGGHHRDLDLLDHRPELGLRFVPSRG